MDHGGRSVPPGVWTSGPETEIICIETSDLSGKVCYEGENVGQTHL